MSATSAFERANAYLLGTIGETISPRTSYKLDRMRALLQQLGEPHLAYPTIHIGGTSGKGSTSTMIASILQTSGKRTGLHTKPHLRSVTERARIDGIAIAEERFAALLGDMMPAIDRIAADYGRPTYYETLLALSFLHFATERVDVAVIEVGLGGRLDGTNVIIPIASAITSVGYDHTDVLGETLEEIAAEKGGIAKLGVPFIVAPAPPAAAAVLARAAGAAGAPIVWASQAVEIVEATLQWGPYAQRCTAVTQRGRYRIELRVHGAFQLVNAATAIAVLESLEDGLRPNRHSMERGFARVTIPARMEVFEAIPVVVVDIAHNAEKIAGLAASLRQEFPQRRFHCVVAISETKNAREILSILAEISATVTCTTFVAAGRRAIAAQQLCELARDLGCSAQAVPDAIDAFQSARRNARSDDIVVVTGSTFVAAAIREWWLTETARGERSA